MLLALLMAYVDIISSFFAMSIYLMIKSLSPGRTFPTGLFHSLQVIS